MDKETYEIYKLISSIMYYNNDKDFNEEAFDIVFIEMMKEIVQLSAQRGYLSNSVKDNVNTFLVAARGCNDENRSKRINIINDIIRIMNGQKEDNTIEFYRMQLATRRNNNKYLNKYPDYVIKKQINEVHLSIVYDYIVVYSHGNEVSDEEFINEFLGDFVESALYYESINAILEENPSMFKDLTFYNRMICVLNLYKETYNNKDTDKYNRKLVKRINKEVKKCK